MSSIVCLSTEWKRNCRGSGNAPDAATLTSLSHNRHDKRQLGAPKPVMLIKPPDYIRTILLDQDGLRRSVHRPLQRLLGQSLLTTRGRIHRQQRALLQPVFQKQRIAALGEVMVEQTVRWSEKWRDGA